MQNRLHLYNISFKYTNKYIINNISISLNPGDILIIKGLNGAGKSTILLLIVGHLIKNYGIVFFNNTNLESTLSQFQHQVIFCTTYDIINFNINSYKNIVFWSIYLGYINYIYEIIFENHTFSLLKTSHSFLSSGQKKKIYLTKSLLSNSPIWILDEPFIVLDKRARILILKQIEYIRSLGGICIISTHVDLNIKKSKYLFL